MHKSPPTETPADKSRERKREQREGYQFAANVSLAVTTFLLFTLGMYQAYLSRQSAEAAMDVARATKGALDEARADRLPLVAFVDMRGNAGSYLGKPHHVELSIINSGKTPALELTFSWGAGNTVAEAAPRQLSTEHEAMALAPNLPTWLFLGEEPSATTIFEKIGKDRVQGVFVRATLDYKDQWGGLHKTDFCGFYPGQGGAHTMSGCSGFTPTMK